MKPLHRLGAATLAAALLSGTAAGALTADAAWATLQTRAQGMGATVSVGSSSNAGGVLKQTNVVVTLPQKDATATLTIPEIDLAQTGDSVTMTLPQPVAFAGSGKNDKGAFSVGGSVSNSGLKTVLSGTEGDMTYASTADTVTVAVDKVESDGKPVDAKVTALLSGLASTSHVAGTDPTSIDSTASLQSVKLDIAATAPKDAAPADAGSFTGHATLAGLNSTSKLTVPKAMDPKNLQASLAAGYALATDLTYGQVAADFDAESQKGPVKGSLGVASGKFSMEMNKDHIRYGGSTTDSKLSVSGGQMPIPSVDLTEKEATMQVVLPVSKSDQSQDFSLLLKLIDIGLNQDVWSILDPKNDLPHDPATVIVDLSGKGQLGFDLFDPNRAGHPPADPGKPESVKLNQLEVKAAGADLTGTGSVTFDNSGPTPQPLGAIDLKLVGGSTLIDKLAAMGLLPQDQVMMAKMMLGMFAKPTGPDTMTSAIEFQPGGAILANGQRIK